MSVAVDDHFHGGIDEFVLVATGKGFRKGDGLLAGGLEGLDVRTHPRHGGIEFAMAVAFLRKAHGDEQRLQVLVFKRGEMSICIHRQNQKVEERLSLGRGETGNIHVHEIMMREFLTNDNATSGLIS